MAEVNNRSWRLEKQVNLSVLVQLVLLAGLIVGSWVNLQRQLDLLGHDVARLLESQKDFQRKLEALYADGISYEYRLQALERIISKTDSPKQFGSEKKEGAYR